MANKYEVKTSLDGAGKPKTDFMLNGTSIDLGFVTIGEDYQALAEAQKRIVGGSDGRIEEIVTSFEFR